MANLRGLFLACNVYVAAPSVYIYARKVSCWLMGGYGEAQRGPERPREAQRGPERPKTNSDIFMWVVK